jgi:hypothetical protein
MDVSVIIAVNVLTVQSYRWVQSFRKCLISLLSWLMYVCCECVEKCKQASRRVDTQNVDTGFATERTKRNVRNGNTAGRYN